MFFKPIIAVHIKFCINVSFNTQTYALLGGFRIEGRVLEIWPLKLDHLSR